ncbi:MAG: hypothetical protein O3A00_05505 [Planctomycetota bacterium]|nr:hypothetical protein [Planctomycetota bacterium]
MDQLHYACLTLNDCGLPHYGECTILLREDMIAHRSSVFEENSAMFVQRKGVPLTKGLRSTWGDRMKLCVAKLARQIDADTNSENFPELLLKPGRQAIDDNFVEVQIFGDMTILTFERVRLASAKASTPTRMRKRTRRGSTDERAVRELCLKHHVFCDIV